VGLGLGPGGDVLDVITNDNQRCGEWFVYVMLAMNIRD
jgi:hypothetical protein